VVPFPLPLASFFRSEHDFAAPPTLHRRPGAVQTSARLDFVRNHHVAVAAMDFLTAPTLTCSVLAVPHCHISGQEMSSDCDSIDCQAWTSSSRASCCELSIAAEAALTKANESGVSSSWSFFNSAVIIQGA
jgi:hypothetical protein